MKIQKLLAIAVAALAFTACSDDDDEGNYNSKSGVTVEMQEAEMLLPEDQPSSSKYYYIPITVVGETNGPVQVTVAVEGVGETPATAGENFVITSETINIPAGENVGYIELYPKGDTEPNEDREFNITIVKAHGAKIGEQATTHVTLLDNELMITTIYQSIQGIWTYTTTSVAEGGVIAYPIEVTGVDEADPEYLKTLYISGIGGFEGFMAKATVSYDATTKTASLTIPGGQMIGTYQNTYDIWLYLGDSDLYYYPGEPLLGEANEDLTEITFGDGQGFFYLYSAVGSTSVQGAMELELDSKMTR